MTSTFQCHECGSSEHHSFDSYQDLPRITSDCKPWEKGGTLSLCSACGLLQVEVNEQWYAEIGEIYGEYESYHQSGGVDQANFDTSTGQAVGRSERVLLNVLDQKAIPTTGRMIDIGCGSGGFLRACSKLLPGWELVGLEQAAHYESEIRAIPGVTDFFPVELEQLTGVYDLISLMHVFEHLAATGNVLKKLGEHLTESGVILIQVPCYEDNPFELVVADHASHFSSRQLIRVVEDAGFVRTHPKLDWVPKELSLIARPSNSAPNLPPAEETDRLTAEEMDRTIEFVNRQIEWLFSIASQAAELSQSNSSFGVFGTSIAATWMVGALGAEAVEFFVDEDQNRIGRRFFGKPILEPGAIGSESVVFMPTPSVAAGPLVQRLASYPMELIIPKA